MSGTPFDLIPATYPRTATRSRKGGLCVTPSLCFPPELDTLLDLGARTGMATDGLRQRARRTLSLDLSEQMLRAGPPDRDGTCIRASADRVPLVSTVPMSSWAPAYRRPGTLNVPGFDARPRAPPASGHLT